MANPNAIPPLEKDAVRPVALVVRNNRTDRSARAILRYIPNRHQWAIVPVSHSVFQKLDLDAMITMNGSARGLSAHLAIIVAEVANQEEAAATLRHVRGSQVPEDKVVLVSTAQYEEFSAVVRKRLRRYKKIDNRVIGLLIANS